jgi:hypothetical protein
VALIVLDGSRAVLCGHPWGEPLGAARQVPLGDLVATLVETGDGALVLETEGPAAAVLAIEVVRDEDGWDFEDKPARGRAVRRIGGFRLVQRQRIGPHGRAALRVELTTAEPWPSGEERARARDAALRAQARGLLDALFPPDDPAD